MLEYCVKHGKGFSVLEFMEEFDLVIEQADQILRDLIKKDYLFSTTDTLQPTATLKSYMFVHRYKKNYREKRKTSFDSHLEYIPINFGKEK